MYSVSEGTLPWCVIKENADDFIVEEVDSSGRVYSVDESYEFSDSYGSGSGDFLHAVLVKRNVDTISAVRMISDKIGLADGRITYAGVKDKRAFTAQRIGLYKFSHERLSGIKFRDMSIYPLGYGQKVFLGDLSGNRFTITLRDIGMGVQDVRDHIGQCLSRLSGVFPNYYGEQRFGTVRPVTFDVGLEILKGNLERALEIYVSRVYDGEPDDIKAIRKIAWGDKKKGYEIFPASYAYERAILLHLVKFPGDYRGAFLQIPLGLRKMFVNAVQSYVFNTSLEMMIDDGAFGSDYDDVEIPIVGYLYSKRLIEDVSDKYVERALESVGVTPKMFKVQAFPELASKGENRHAFQKFSDFEIVSIDSDEKSKPPRTVAVVRFFIPRGSYATVFLREFFGF